MEEVERRTGIVTREVYRPVLSNNKNLNSNLMVRSRYTIPMDARHQIELFTYLNKKSVDHRNYSSELPSFYYKTGYC